MDPRPETDQFAMQVRVLQIIGFALVAGLVFFLILAVFLVQTGQQFGTPSDIPILTYIAVGFFVVQVIMWQVVPRLFVKHQLQKIADGTWTLPRKVQIQFPSYAIESDTDKLFFVYQTQFIVGMALLEGAGFLACIAYLLEGDLVSLVVAGLLVMLMLSSFPFRDRVQRWIDHKLVRVEEIRRDQGPAA